MATKAHKLPKRVNAAILSPKQVRQIAKEIQKAAARPRGHTSDKREV
jgi:hypothetical protein